MLFRNTVFTEHVPDSPNERWGVGSTSMTRQVDLRSGLLASRVQAAADFLGYAAVLPTGQGSGPTSSGFYIHRVTPMPYPIDMAPPLPAPGDTSIVPNPFSRIYVVGISRTEPLGIPGPDLGAFPSVGTNYSMVRLSVEFSCLPYFVKDDATLMASGGIYNGAPDEGVALAKGWWYSRYISRQRSAFSRIVRIPYGMMQTNALGAVNPAKPNKTAIPFREGGSTFHYTWMRVPLEGANPGVNFGRIGSYLGTINLLPFDGCAPGTLLFDSYSTREYQGALGEWLADVTFNMIYLPHISTGARLAAGEPNAPAAGTATGWNTVVDIFKYSNPNSLLPVFDYFPVTVPLGVQLPFQYSDFSALFRP